MPRRNPAAIRSVSDLARRPQLKLVVAGAKVPVGLYTREVLKRLGLLRVLRKAVSQEPDVKGIVGKLALGEADAGFVYATDVRAAGDEARRDRPAAARATDDPLRGGGREGDEEPRGAFELVADLLGVDGRRELGACGLRAAVSRLFPAALVLAAAIALGFLLLPILAIFLRIPPGDLRPECGARPRSTRCS